jgi:feruloyl esterase
VQSVKAPVAPFPVQATRPLCQYPDYPNYRGGDRLQAASYACARPALQEKRHERAD